MKKGYKQGKQGTSSVTAKSLYSSLELAGLASAARVDEDPRVRNLVRAVHYSGNPQLAQSAREYLEAKALEQALDPDPFLPPLEPEQAKGNLVLGRVKNSLCFFGLLLVELCQHILIVGRSGAGKTTLVKRLLKELLSLSIGIGLGVKVLIFDIKRDYGVLKQMFAAVWVFQPGTENFRWNPLEPPIKDWRRWAGILASSMANAFGFIAGQGTENLMYKILMELYSKYDPDRGVYPSLPDLLDYMYLLKLNKRIDARSEEFKWFVRFFNRVESVCHSFRQTVECSSGYPLVRILNHHVIFDLAELKPDAQSFFSELMLQQALWHRIESGERGGITRTLAVFDEGKRLMPKYREQSQQGICNMSNTLAMAREFGLAMLLAECEPSLLADSIKSSAFARFCFNQTHGRDIKDSIAMLDLDFEQAAELQKLGVGQAICRLADRIKRPFILEVMP